MSLPSARRFSAAFALVTVKAIPTADSCRTCLGTDVKPGVKPGVKAKVAELYSDDRATGFTPGDMRGIFTPSKGM